MSPTPSTDPADSFGFQTVGEFAPEPSGIATSPPVVASAADPVADGNKARIQAGRMLSQLKWTFPDGTTKHPKLTSSRWALHAAVLAETMPAIKTEDITKALTIHTHRRYLSATLLLWLCLHEPEAWEEPRGGRVALVNDWHALAREARRWTDENIPASRMDDAVTLAETMADLTFSAIPVRRATAEDETEEPQKKTQE